MRILVASLLLFPAIASAQSFAEEPASDTILLLPEAEALGLGEVLETGETVTIWIPADAIAQGGPHGRAAWRGAKTGALVGLGISAVALGAALVYDANGGCADMMICTWHLATLGAVPITLSAGAAGAFFGWTTSISRANEPRPAH